MRVLLIDDEQFYFKLIRKSLKESEYEIEYAQSGSEGLSKIPSFNPELLIVDLKMPGMDGFQILERLRRDAKFSHIPVIVITAQNERSQKRNRDEALARLVDLVRQAAVKPVKRRATKPTKASREKRLESKKRRSGIKGLRQNKPRAE